MTCAFMAGCNEDTSTSIKTLETVAANLEQVAKTLEAATKHHKDLAEIDKANLEQAVKALVANDKAKSERYEYKTVYTVRDSDDLTSLKRGFDALGKEGWKFAGFCMVDSTNGRVCLFSRKMP